MIYFIKIFASTCVFLIGGINYLYAQCDFQPGTPSGGTETVCFYDSSDVLLGCSYNCQVTGQQIKCGYKAGSEPWSNYYKVTFSSQICYSPSALPVRLLSFSLSLAETGIDINWITGSEKNSSHFEIQKSENGYDFHTIASIKAAGNSFSEIKDKYLDNNIRSNLNYYRLIQFDLDGQYETFKILSLNYFPYDGLKLVNYNDDFYQILTQKVIDKVISIALDGKEKIISLDENLLIKKSNVNQNIIILKVIYQDKTSDFKRFIFVNE